MSAAAAEAAPAKKGNKKLIIIIGAVVAVLLLGGVGAMMMMKKNAAAAAAAEEEGGEGAAAPKKAKAVKQDPGAPPSFAPLEPFTVNLADRDSERFAQVGITLELMDASVEAQIKSFMPVIRNNILLAISDKTAAELMSREGKARLAGRIQRETSRALGADVPDEEELAAEAEAEAEDAPKKRRRRAAEPDLPIKAVHFSNFIIQ